ncbi:D-aminoacyl-tRNA deacylase [Williamwhitmania taraxaci]|uniref:D-aminoacyl-tRNA deacylase n=1 Tax=Williamwhitmania taraxaci TaxID=1640674 RepID=A0A1G6GZD9_9BACT|nr:D-aminoacyl-tRNA deacylase [Williamwhitmania taraxaci]SDB87420.1 D-tyrosyl-tRNA(Tyr) deacylase [Williamwhitmania taraxaci]
MRGLVQRVIQASVTIDGSVVAEIGNGVLVLVGIEAADTTEDSSWLASKISALRIFDDENGVMNKSLVEIRGEALVVSQFTLHALTKKGNRPSYIKAARPEVAIPLYEQFIYDLQLTISTPIKTGSFGAHMQLSLINDGPVTIWIDTKSRE